MDKATTMNLCARARLVRGALAGLAAAALLASADAADRAGLQGRGMTPGSGTADHGAVGGGIGIGERQAMREQPPEHNVRMTFAVDTGNYLADVHVRVIDASGRQVIDGTVPGPWLYAELPPGRYTATATFADRSLTRRFDVSHAGERTVDFRWPARLAAAQGDVEPVLRTRSAGTASR